MKIYFPLETVKAIAAAGCKSEVLSDPEHIYRGCSVESREILQSDYAVIRKVLKGDLLQVIDNRRILKKLEALESLAALGKKDKPLRMLELVPEAVRDVVGRTPHRWLFMNDDTSGIMLPWFVEDAEYHEAVRTSNGYSPARASISLKGHRRGKIVEAAVTLYKQDLVGTLIQALEAKGAFLETANLCKDFEADLAHYKEHYTKTGEQYLAFGHGWVLDGRWKRNAVGLERDGAPAKVVMDDLEDEEGRDAHYVQTDFWVTSKTKTNDDGEEAVEVPTHPLVRAFNLDTHEYIETHVTNLKPYEYRPEVVDKLILPAEHKSLIGALTRQSAGQLEDIVRGKAAGVIVLCSGLPGTGKTLTAEIYSEVVKRPLYSVQCSQLGTNEEDLEKELSAVLSRASRWKAILLIDEADVYIHERGEDIRQNAIVGVFLRLLEYFRGIMFMTTNRPTVVDDAILSRVTAHVRYVPPTDSVNTNALWRVMAVQYGAVNLDLTAAAKTFPGVSGRSMRQLLRLAAMLYPAKDISVATLKWAASFYDFPELQK